LNKGAPPAPLGRAPSPLEPANILYFGPVWWLVATAPLAVTYLSPRHLYLASVAVAIGIAFVVEGLWRARRPNPRAGLRATLGIAAGTGTAFGPLAWPARMTALALAGVLLLACAARSQTIISDWTTAATLSAKIVRDLDHESRTLPPG